MRSSYYSKNAPLMDEVRASGLVRWLPTFVVLSVLSGFISLSWYAYHASVQSVREEDLLVIEADKTPIKEKPLDPGGMHFPNQDKTIFDTFANTAPPPLKVERILPGPEEPMARNADMSDTDSWINEKLQRHDPEHETAKADSITVTPSGSVMTKPIPASESASIEPVETPASHRQVIKAHPASANVSETYVAEKPITASEMPKNEEAAQKPAAPPAKPVMKTEDIKAKAPAVATKTKMPAHDVSGTASVQLGAYRSQPEATQAWAKIRAKHPELANRQPTIVKADLGAKGTYYRLRVGGLASTEAKALCKALAVKHQACMLPQ